ncbi:T9SS type A sorting domain-containing protein [candidate division KSB1 bacterium]|nr:T9SS type A sorting domain-containing protein [candidate division KSB1 bacterium]
MNKLHFLLLLSTIFFLLNTTVSARDPYKQPFHETSIWNMPIGSNAEYVHAKIQPASAYGMTIDEDLIVLTPDAPNVAIYRSDAGWNREKSRCDIDGGILFEAPIPDDFVVSPDTWDGLTPNSGLAVLMDDGYTIRQTQPFARCEAGENGTSRYTFDDEDLFGDGYYGAHGATKLSAIGGAIRLGELVPGASPIPHTLKVNIYAAKNVYYDSKTKGYRWPAKSADSYASGNYGTQGDPVEELRMGALLALPSDMNLDDLDLETEPARMLAQAFQNYGAYLVDDTAWDVYAIITEWSPQGRVKDEFKKAWGFSMSASNQNSAWAKDMRKIYTNLHVVVNNGPDSIGGGGEPRVPMAKPLSYTHIQKKTQTPKNIELKQNYPNPFNPQTQIQIVLPQQSEVSIDVYDILGQKVDCIVQQELLSSGIYSFMFDGSKLSSGVYFCKLETESEILVNKMMLLR